MQACSRRSSSSLTHDAGRASERGCTRGAWPGQLEARRRDTAREEQGKGDTASNKRGGGAEPAAPLLDCAESTLCLTATAQTYGNQSWCIELAQATTKVSALVRLQLHRKASKQSRRFERRKQASTADAVSTSAMLPLRRTTPCSRVTGLSSLALLLLPRPRAQEPRRRARS